MRKLHFSKIWKQIRYIRFKHNIKRNIQVNLRKYLIVVFLFATLSVIHVPLLVAYGNWLSPSTIDPTSDIAVALGSINNRLGTAIGLLKGGYVKALYVDDLTQKEFTEAISKHNIPAYKAHWGGESATVNTTFGEALAFRDTMSRQRFSYRQIVIVSNKYHLRRAQWSFQLILPKVKVKTYAVPESNTNANVYWWQHQNSWRWVVKETQKLGFYWFYYGLLGNRIPKDLSESDLFFD